MEDAVGPTWRSQMHTAPLADPPPLPITPQQSTTPQLPSEAELSLWQQLLQRLPPGETPPRLDGLCAQQRMSVIMDRLSKTMPVSAADG